jgi:hypothetical protein
MKRAFATGLVLGAAVLLMAARPGTELQLFTQLNGQPVRWALPDAGASGLYNSSGQACAKLTGGSPLPVQVVMVVPEVPINICVRPATSTFTSGSWTNTGWDGGCNSITKDFNFGVPLQPYVPWYVVVDPNATQICAVSDGGLVSAALWLMQ